MANIGFIPVEKNMAGLTKVIYPNFALMRAAGYHRSIGDKIYTEEDILFDPFLELDRIYMSKIFTWTPDYENMHLLPECDIIKGGTGYDVHSRLPEEIEASTKMDYSLYPDFPASLQFFSRGCIRHCKFCLVHDKEGAIHPVEPVELNPNGKFIEVLDNNFFANPEWPKAIEYLKKLNQPVKFHGADLRILEPAHMEAIKSVRLHGGVHFAWDYYNENIPATDLTDRIKLALKYVHPSQLNIYVLIGFNTTMKQDLYRINTLRNLNIPCQALIYRDYTKEYRKPSEYEFRLSQYTKLRQTYFKMPFEEYNPTKAIHCGDFIRLGRNLDGNTEI